MFVWLKPIIIPVCKCSCNWTQPYNYLLTNPTRIVTRCYTAMLLFATFKDTRGLKNCLTKISLDKNFVGPTFLGPNFRLSLCSTSWSWAGAQSRLRQLDSKLKFSEMDISLRLSFSLVWNLAYHLRVTWM